MQLMQKCVKDRVKMTYWKGKTAWVLEEQLNYGKLADKNTQTVSETPEQWAVTCSLEFSEKKEK